WREPPQQCFQGQPPVQGYVECGTQLPYLIEQPKKLSRIQDRTAPCCVGGTTHFCHKGALPRVVLDPFCEPILKAPQAHRPLGARPALGGRHRVGVAAGESLERTARVRADRGDLLRVEPEERER